MPTEAEFAAMRQKISDEHGGREGHLLMQIIHLAQFEQPTDVTFYNRPPLLDVKIESQVGTALMYGAGAGKLAEFLNRIDFSDGSHANFAEIWTLNPMPKGGIAQAELDEVDLEAAEQKAGPNGETLREMISQTYHCKSREEEDRFIRRFIAS